MLDRRQFLRLGAGAGLLPLAGSCGREPSWQAAAWRKQARSRVAVLEAPSYEVALSERLRHGLRLFGLDLQGRRVVLKPNLVEFDPNSVINTHPAVIAAAVEAFLGLGAREVVVAEGPGHRRDNEYILSRSGLLPVLRERRVRYVDLNYDDVLPLALRSDFTELGRLYFPKTVLEADLLVSMPKLKTHHWAGVTLSMKNLFGVIPGSVYGWPKNALHWAGIDGSIVDIASTLPTPRFAIVDGILGMEGNGPIQGDPRRLGALILGDDFAAVDATCARLMRIDPVRVRYLAWAGRFLGNVEAERIEQIGERAEDYQQDFRVLPQFQGLKV